MRGSVESLVDLAFFFAGDFLLSVVINAIMMRFVRNLGMRHQQDITVRWSNQSKPAVGGIPASENKAIPSNQLIAGLDLYKPL